MPELISALCHREPQETIAWVHGRPVSVGEFLHKAQLLSECLPKRRFLINLYADRYQFLLGFTAAMMARQTMLMPPNRQPAFLDELLQSYPDCYRLGPAAADDIAIPASDDLPSSGALNESRLRLPSNHPCAIAFTSGSTGKPTENLKTWEMLRAGTESNVSILLGARERLNFLATVPGQHMWGLETSVLLPLLATGTISARHPLFPEDIADALRELPSPRALISSPAHLDALLKSGVTLPPLARVFTATAPLADSLRDEFERSFATRISDIYGCSETGILAHRNSDDNGLWRLSEAFSMRETDSGVVVSAAHLDAGVLLPDQLELVAPQRFRWLGRNSDMVNIAGKRASLTDLNHRLLAIPGVIDGVIFSPDDDAPRLHAFVVALDLTPSDILGALRRQIEPVLLPRPVYMVQELPRQETGKITRQSLLNLLAEVTVRHPADLS